MIKIAIAAALAALIVCDVTILPASTGKRRSNDRVATKAIAYRSNQPGTGCSDVVWQHHHGDCVGGHQQPSKQAPAARHVRIVATDRMPAGNPVPSFAI